MVNWFVYVNSIVLYSFVQDILPADKLCQFGVNLINILFHCKRRAVQVRFQGPFLYLVSRHWKETSCNFILMQLSLRNINIRN